MNKATLLLIASALALLSGCDLPQCNYKTIAEVWWCSSSHCAVKRTDWTFDRLDASMSIVWATVKINEPCSSLPPSTDKNE